MSNQLFPLSDDALRLVRCMQTAFATVSQSLAELSRICPDDYWDIWAYFDEARSPHYAANIGESACDELINQHNQHAMQSMKRKKRRKAA